MPQGTHGAGLAEAILRGLSGPVEMSTTHSIIIPVSLRPPPDRARQSTPLKAQTAIHQPELPFRPALRVTLMPAWWFQTDEISRSSSLVLQTDVFPRSLNLGLVLLQHAVQMLIATPTYKPSARSLLKKRICSDGVVNEQWIVTVRVAVNPCGYEQTPCTQLPPARQS